MNLSLFWSVCASSSPSTLASISRCNKELSSLREDLELLNTFLVNYQVNGKSEHYSQWLKLIDDNLFSPGVPADYRRLRWKIATANRPVEAITSCILIKDFETALYILDRNYNRNQLPSELERLLTAYTLTVDPEVTWMKENGINYRHKIDFECYRMIPGWEYYALSQLMIDDKPQLESRLLAAFIRNKDYETVRLLFDNVDKYIEPPYLMEAILLSGNREVYENPSILGIDLSNIDDEDEVEKICDYCTNLDLFKHLHEIGMVTNENYCGTGCGGDVHGDIEMLMWKIETFPIYREWIIEDEGFVDYSSLKVEPTVEECLYYFKRMSHVLDLPEDWFFHEFCRREYIGTYVARELTKHYIDSFTERRLHMIRKYTNAYQDKEFNSLIREIEKML